MRETRFSRGERDAAVAAAWAAPCGAPAVVITALRTIFSGDRPRHGRRAAGRRNDQRGAPKHRPR